MAGIMRRTRHAAAIAGVYTPPRVRGRGYAGSVTAAVVDAIFAEGRNTACLYVDLRNPYSSRCYAKIGFTPVCRPATTRGLLEPPPRGVRAPEAELRIGGDVVKSGCVLPVDMVCA